MQDGETVEKKVEAFNIRLDSSKKPNGDETKYTEELTVPFCLPDKMLPTLIQKDQRAKLSYLVKVSVRFIEIDSLPMQSVVMLTFGLLCQVEFYSGRKHESTLNLPLIVVGKQ